MKKFRIIITLFFSIALLFSLSSCQIAFTEHEHKFKTETVAPTCENDGYNVHVCDCGCVYRDNFIDKIGHKYAEDADEFFLYSLCLNGCGTFKNKQEDLLTPKLQVTYNTDDGLYFSDIEEDSNFIVQLVNNLDDYDENLHHYDLESELYNTYLEFADYFYDTFIYSYGYLNDQLFVLDMLYMLDNEVETYNKYIEVYEFTSQIYNKRTSLLKTIYSKSIREYFYSAEDGWTEESIEQTLNQDSETANELFRVADDYRKQIESLSEEELFSDDFLTLYRNYVSSYNVYVKENTEYDNMMDYFYYEQYYRDYNYDYVEQSLPEIKNFIKNFSELIEEKYSEKNKKYAKLSTEDALLYNSLVDNNFLEDANVFRLIGDYYKKLQEYNTFEEVNYVDFVSKVFKNKLYTFTVRDMAFTSLLDDIPFITLGNDPYYLSSNVIIHELGHALEFDYQLQNYDDCLIVFDLSEFHSQANELMFYQYIRNFVSKDLAELLELDFAYDMYYLFVISFSMAEFEHEVISKDASGDPYSENEYEQLYIDILEDYVSDTDRYKNNWRYAVQHSTCYYISYAVSLISSYEILLLDSGVDFVNALTAYNKMIEHRNANDTHFVLANESYEFAGLESPFDTELYSKLLQFFKIRFS